MFTLVLRKAHVGCVLCCVHVVADFEKAIVMWRTGV